MTASTDFDRLVASWLETAGPLTPSEDVVDGAMERARGLQQRTGWRARISGPAPWPGSRPGLVGGLPIGMRVALLVGLLAIIAGMAAMVGTRLATQPDPSPPTLPSPSAVPSAGGPAPEPVRGTWLTANPGIAELNATGPVIKLLVDPTGKRAWLAVGDLGWYGSLRVASSVETGEAGLLRLVATMDDHGCRKGDEGLYKAVVSPDGVQMTLQVISDACPTRTIALGRRWDRALTGPNLGGTGVVDAFDPAFTVTLPAGPYTAALSPGAVEIHHINDKDEIVPRLMAFKDPQGFADPCDGGSRFALAPGADAFVEYFRSNPGFTVVSTEELTVGGRRAVRLVVDGKADYTCDTGNLVEWAPADDTSTLVWSLAPGDRDILYVVDAGAATLLFVVLPIDATQADAIIGSIRFLDGLPAATP